METPRELNPRPTSAQLVLLFALSCLVGTGIGAACRPSAPAKTALRAIDYQLQLACQGLAQQLAAKSGASAEQIVAKTCAVEGFTRTLRESLLSQQINEAKANGVAVPDINSGALEDDAEALPAE